MPTPNATPLRVGGDAPDTTTRLHRRFQELKQRPKHELVNIILGQERRLAELEKRVSDQMWRDSPGQGAAE